MVPRFLRLVRSLLCARERLWCMCLCLCCVVAAAGAVAQPQQGRAGLPPQLEAARERLTLEQTGSRAFHLEAELQVTSDTGAASHGTFTEDWWTDLWWRQVTVMNGLRREVIEVGGKVLRDEDEGFVLPFRAETLLLALRRPFPQRAQALPPTAFDLEQVGLHCLTLPEGFETADLVPAPKHFCTDGLGDLRLTADPTKRVIYNDIASFGTHHIALRIEVLAGKQMVGTLKVVQLRARADGPEVLQHMGLDEQVRFATAQPRITVLLKPAWMQRQVLSVDARLMPLAAARVRSDQKFAALRVLESEGKLLDAEVLLASDATSARLALDIAKRASFRFVRGPGKPVAYEGTLVLATP